MCTFMYMVNLHMSCMSRALMHLNTVVFPRKEPKRAEAYGLSTATHDGLSLKCKISAFLLY